MKFTPRTEEEVKVLFEKGNYPFTVLSAIEKTSKNGNPMISLKLQIEHTTIPGKTGFAKCNLMTNNPNFEFLLRHFCYSIGMGAEYEKGELEPRNILGKRGIAKIGIETDGTGEFPDQNKAVDFVVSDNVVKHGSFDDELPF